MENKKQSIEDTIDLLDLAKKLIRFWWLFLIAILIGGIGAGGYSKYMIEPEYKAECMVYVNNGSISVGSTSVSLQDLNASQSLVDTYMVILESRKVLMEVADEAGLSYSYERMKNMVSSSKVGDTEVFSVFVTSTDPEEAALVANVIADVLPDYIADIVEGSSVKIVDYAVVPTNKISPDIKKNAMIGAAALFVIVGLLLVLRILLDNTIQEVTDIFDITKFPLLAKIPDHSEKKKGKTHHLLVFGHRQKVKAGKYTHTKVSESITDNEKQYHIGSGLSFATKEAYRLLRTNVKYSIPAADKGKIIGITSSVASEFKTTTAINLALSLTMEANNRVLLLDCDLRMSEVDKRLNITKKLGLTDYLTGDLNIKDLIYSVEQYPNLSVIIGGNTSPNPGELLCSPKMKECFALLAEMYDYIIVDFPPANIVSDALELGKECDGMIVVVRQNYTEKQSLEESLRKLDFLSINVLGLVFTGVSTPGGSYNKNYYYKKYYGSYRQYDKENEDQTP